MESNFQVGDWLVSPKLNSLSSNYKTVRVEPKVMQVLVCLAETGDVVSKDVLMSRVWADTFVTDDVLTRCISELPLDRSEHRLRDAAGPLVPGPFTRLEGFGGQTPCLL